MVNAILPRINGKRDNNFAEEYIYQVVSTESEEKGEMPGRHFLNIHPAILGPYLRKVKYEDIDMVRLRNG